MNTRLPQRSEKPGDILTDRMVFLLRHYDSQGVSNFVRYQYFAQAVFEYDHPGMRLTTNDREGWEKVSDYASRYMVFLGLLQMNGTRYAITTEGHKLVDTNDFRAKNARTFAMQPVKLP